MKLLAVTFYLFISISLKSQTEFNKFNHFVKEPQILWAHGFVTTLKFSFHNFSYYNFLYSKIFNNNEPTYFFEDLKPTKTNINLIDTLKDVIWEGNYFAVEHRRYSRPDSTYKTLFLKYKKDEEEKILVKEIIYYKDEKLYSKPYLAMPFLNQFTIDSNDKIPFPKYIGYLPIDALGGKNKRVLLNFISIDTFDISYDNNFRVTQNNVKEYFNKNFINFIQENVVQKNKLQFINDSNLVIKMKEANYYFYEKPQVIQIPVYNDTSFSKFKDTLIYNDLNLIFCKTFALKRKWTYDKANNILTNRILEVHLLYKNEEYYGLNNSLIKLKYSLACKIHYK